MNVSITPELERFVHDLVATGRYHSASEVFRDGLRLLEQAEHKRLLEKWLAEGLTPDEEERLPAGLANQNRARLRAKIQAGLDEALRGAFVNGEDFFAKWKARLEGSAAGRSKRPNKKQRS